MLYTVRSERQLMEQVDYNLLFRWFVGLTMDDAVGEDDAVGDPTVFTKNRQRLLGWLKTVGLMRKLRHRGTGRVDWVFTFATAVYNLVRIRNLTEQAA